MKKQRQFSTAEFRLLVSHIFQKNFRGDGLQAVTTYVLAAQSLS
jgi:hypothetical protein